MNVSPDGSGTVKIDGASVTNNPYTGDYANGAVVSVEALPAPGYVFIGWSGGISGTSNPASVDMTCNRTIKANFSSVFEKLPWPVIGGVGGAVIAGGLTFALFALVKHGRRS